MPPLSAAFVVSKVILARKGKKKYSMHHSSYLIYTIPGHVNLLGISLLLAAFHKTHFFETVHLILICSQCISANLQCSLNHHVPNLPRVRLFLSLVPEKHT